MQQDPAGSNEKKDSAIEARPAIKDRFFQSTDANLFESWMQFAGQIELEIGSGKGLYLSNTAPQQPSIRYVGLELAAKYAIDCQSRVEARGINNLRFFACEACEVLRQDVRNGSLSAVHVYFPDPWWKSRHKKRRVLSEQTLIDIERTLKPGGALHFWTDVLDYYESTLELIEQVTSLQGPYFVSEPPATHDMDYRTHFERRTRINGLPVYRSRFEKQLSTLDLNIAGG